MANKKALIWIAIASTVLIGGGITWWMISKNRNKGGSEKDLSNGHANLDPKTGLRIDPTKDDDGKPIVTSGGGTGNTNTGGGSYTPPPPSVGNPFKSATDVKAFQDWLDNVHPNWINNGGGLHGGGGYGNFGSKTQKAWSDYGAEYTGASTPTTKPSPSPVSTGFKNGDLVYLSDSGAVFYSYPQMNSQYILGQIKKNVTLDKPIGKFIANVTGGFSKVEIVGYQPYSNGNWGSNYIVKKTTAYVPRTKISQTPY